MADAHIGGLADAAALSGTQEIPVDQAGTAKRATLTELQTFILGDADAADLTKLSEVTASSAELNIVDGVTASAAEINLIDGSVAGTAVASKALVLGADKNVDVLAVADLKLGAGAGTSVTADAAELNILDGATLTVTELNFVDGVTSAIQTQLDAKQPLDATLTAFAGLTIADGKLPYGNGSDTFAVTDLTAFGRSLIDDADAGTALTTLGVSAFVQTILDDANGAAVIATIGAAPAASPTFTGTVTLPTGLTGVIRADSGVVSVDSDVTDIVAAATTSAAGKSELATTSEVNTGTDADRTISPDTLAGSYAGTKSVCLVCFGPTIDCQTGDGAAYYDIPSDMNGMNLVRVYATATTAGTTGTMDIQVANATQAADMLSTKMTIDSTEVSTATAAVAAVIDTGNDDVATNDVIRIDVDAVQTTKAKGLRVTLEFRLP